MLLLRSVRLQRNPVDYRILLDLFVRRLRPIVDALIAQQSDVLVAQQFFVINSRAGGQVALPQPQVQACRRLSIIEAFHVEVLPSI